MAFIWNDESLAILRENAGILTTEQIAQLLHTALLQIVGGDKLIIPFC
ncbi:TPA: hypothetical protein ACJHB6_004554 [Escherichia coli]|nr:hypothetical protein [Escherichia coli]